MVALVVLFVLRYFPDLCDRLLVFCVRFALICGVLSVALICVRLRGKPGQ